MGLNSQQEKIVYNLDGALNVAAGAGTGKTYTLTQRIVHCVKEILNTHPTLEYPLRSILAITFTDKAAEELRSRVREALIYEAEQMADERLFRCALDVDNAWISTIHSMASRILRENALDFAIDPSFEVLTEAQSESIFNNALESVLQRARLDDNYLVKELLVAFPLYPVGKFSQCVSSMIRSIAAKAEYMPYGIEGVSYAGAKESPKTLLKRLMDESFKIRAILESADGWQGASANERERLLGEVCCAIDRTQGYLKENISDDFLGEDFDAAQYLSVLMSYPPTTQTFPKKPEEFNQIFSEYRYVYRDVLRCSSVSIGLRRIKAIIKITGEVYRQMDLIKTDQKTLLSQSDVLRVCNAKLSESANADVVQKYRDQFAYIMVDEFQDTDRLQMDIIAKLARRDGLGGHAGLINVCTVGDMQQAIYRFRGGDVTLAKQRTLELEDIDGANCELSSNYRSHASILDSVDMVFSQREVFGSDFLRLDACAASLDEHLAALFSDSPRVKFDFLHYSSNNGVDSDSAKRYCAMRIAEHFSDLFSKDVPKSKMAILLGETKNADIYIDALAQKNLESVLVKGSVFSSASEPNLVLDILKYTANSDEEISLFRILVSPLFAISDDDLLLLATKKTDSGFKYRGISEGFSSLMKRIRSLNSSKDVEEVKSEGYTDGAVHAASIMGQFLDTARGGSVASSIRDLLLNSGLIYRLEHDVSESGNITASALSSAANFNKAIDQVEKLEQGGLGICSLAYDFRRYLETAKETPGTLSTSESDFVKIITAHSSKGLEYDHVVIADLKDGISKSSRFIVENCGDKTYIAMKATKAEYPSPSKAKIADGVEKFSFADLDEDDVEIEVADIEQAYKDNDAYKLFSRLNKYVKQQDFEESRRLLYVAMTRARETLVLNHVSGASPKSSYKGIYGDVHTALKKRLSLAEEDDGSDIVAVEMPIAFQRKSITTQDLVDFGVCDEFESSSISNVEASSHVVEQFCTPVYKEPAPIDFSGFTFGMQDVFSYTSLSKSEKLNLQEDSCAIDASMDMDASAEKGSRSDHFDAFVQEVTLDDAGRMRDADKATDLGEAFHRLAQLSIIDSAQTLPDERVFEMPNTDRIEAQIRRCRLSDAQASRLKVALERWFDSDECKRFTKCQDIMAEVPFIVQVKDGTSCFYLEGEIDGLGVIDDKTCLFIDYKTGGNSSESVDSLHKKHLLQAQCYAYALLSSGFESVEAHFIRVEQCDPCYRSEPEIVKYLFKSCDIDNLRDAIVSAYLYAIDQDD